MTAKRLPLTKEFPGKYVTRSKIWTPTGASVGFEGWIEKEVAELILGCLVGAERITPDLLAEMRRITAQLMPKKVKP